MKGIEPYFSIITVVKNAEYTIERCILSVLECKLKLPTSAILEYIIVDGESNDRTKSIISKYTNIVIDKYISEKDLGISDAFNKGFIYAKGEWILYLNADDWLCSECLQLSIPYLIKINPKVTFVTGAVNLWENENLITLSYSRVKTLSRESSLHHAATLIRSKNILNEEKFRLDLKYAMDYEFFLRLIVFKKHFVKTLPIVFANRTLSGISYRNYKLALQETKFIRLKYYNVLNSNFWYYFAGFKIRIGIILKRNNHFLTIYRFIWSLWNKNF